MISINLKYRETGETSHIFSFTEEIIPSDMSYFDFVSDYLNALAQYEHVDWDFDFTKATPTEAQYVERANIIARVKRAFSERRPIRCCNHRFLVRSAKKINSMEEEKLMRRHLSSFGKKFNSFNQDGDLGIVTDNKECLIIGKVAPVIRLH